MVTLAAEVFPEPAPGAPRVLVVDDVAEMAELVQRTLRRQGYQVVVASDGREALEVLRAQSIDLVVCDWTMPRMSGPEVIEAMRADPRISGVPVVLLTARSDEESRMMGKDFGADAFLGKPFHSAELVTTVRNLLKLKAREREVTILNRNLTENVLKRYLAPELVDAVLEGRLELATKPRLLEVTVVFADLVGFTALSESLPADEVGALISMFLTRMTDVAFEYGATIDKFMGDAIMLLFGAHSEMVPAEQAARASACAAAMHTACESMAAHWPGGLPRLRVGIHHGPAVVGNVGSPRRSDFTAIGATVNLASRIQAICSPGRTAASKAFCELLAPSATVPIGSHVIKGVGEVPLFELVSGDG